MGKNGGMAIFYPLPGDLSALRSRSLELPAQKRKTKALRPEVIMSEIRLEKLRRLTLPPEIIAQAGLRQDDELEAS